MKLADLRLAKRILVYGYGLEGRSTEKFLRTKTEAEMVIFDENIAEFQANSDFENYEIIVVSAGIDRQKIPRNFYPKITSNPEIFFNNLSEKLRSKVIGISGTKGKSTTTKFCAEFLQNMGQQVAIGGNYGIPLLDLFENFSNGDLDFLVAELSSYQLENLQTSPHFAIFLNFFPDHLDRHQTLENYWHAKSQLWQNQQVGDFLFIPQNSEIPKQKIITKAQICRAESLEPKNFAENSVFRAEHWRENLGTIKNLAEKIFPTAKEKIALMLQKTAKNFAGLPHRMEFFTEKSGIKFYDDSISTNPDSTLASVNFFAENLGCIILGGQNRQQDFTQLLSKLKDLQTLVIILPTETRENLLATAQKVGLTNFIDFPNWTGFAKISQTIFQQNFAKKVCLLSCAAPSYDLFKNFKDRGQQWKKAVLEA